MDQHFWNIWNFIVFLLKMIQPKKLLKILCSKGQLLINQFLVKKVYLQNISQSFFCCKCMFISPTYVYLIVQDKLFTPK